MPTTSTTTPTTGAGRLTPITTPVHGGGTTTTLTFKSTISVPTKSAASITNVSNFLQATPAVSKILAERRNAHDNWHRISMGEVAEEESEVGNNPRRNDAVVVARQVEEPVSTLSATNTLGGDDEGSAVLVSYFGVCVSNTTTGWTCTKKRHHAESLGSSPLKFLELGGSLQGAISPLPPIIAVALQGSLILLSCFLGFRSSAGLQTKLGKFFLILSFAAFGASLFAAVLFQSAAGMIYSAFITSDTIVVSKGSGGIALAWAGVFFTGLALAGVIMLALLANDPQGASNYVSKKEGQQKRDIEMPPVRGTSVRAGGYGPGKNERSHPQRGDFKPEGSGHKYSQQVEDMKQGKSPFVNGWNVV